MKTRNRRKFSASASETHGFTLMLIKEPNDPPLTLQESHSKSPRRWLLFNQQQQSPPTLAHLNSQSDPFTKSPSLPPAALFKRQAGGTLKGQGDDNN